MTNENRTKCSLDSALRTLLAKKPLDQIRVREVTDLCAIRRQSFYYHFPDVYALYDWSLERESAALCRLQEDCLTWQQALGTLLGHMTEQQPYYLALLELRGQEGLARVLDPALDRLLAETVDYYRRRCGVPAKEDPAGPVYWKTVLLALLEGWLRGGLAQPPEELIRRLEVSVQRETLGAAWQNMARWA